jgi:hypothetical protein
MNAVLEVKPNNRSGEKERRSLKNQRIVRDGNQIAQRIP